MPPKTLKRKPRNHSAVANPPAKREKTEDSNTPNGTSTPPATSRKNLTLADWLTVYAYVDQHPTAKQGDVVRHFAILESGALTFDQSTLSRKLRERPDMEARVNDDPSALSSKRPLARPKPETQLPARPAVVADATSQKWKPEQLIRAEEELMEQLRRLQSRGLVSGQLLSIDELVDPVEERIEEDATSPTTTDSDSDSDSNSDSDSDSDSDGSVAEIVERIFREMVEAGGQSDDEDEVDEEPTGVALSRAELIKMCQQLEEACMHHGDPSSSYELSRQLRKFRGVLRKEELLNSKQTSLDNYFS